MIKRKKLALFALCASLVMAPAAKADTLAAALAAAYNNSGLLELYRALVGQPLQVVQRLTRLLQRQPMRPHCGLQAISCFMRVVQTSLVWKRRKKLF